MKNLTKKEQEQLNEFNKKNGYMKWCVIKQNIIRSYGLSSITAKELTSNEFIYELFSEAIDKGFMQSKELEKGKANGLITLYSPKKSKVYHEYLVRNEKKVPDFCECRKPLVINTDNVLSIDNIDGLKACYIYPHLLHGKKGGINSLSYLCNFDLDVDDILTMNDLKKFINLIIDGKIPVPTIITNSGNGIHVVYRLKEPINIYENIHEKENLTTELLEIKIALCMKISKEMGFKKIINKLSLNQQMRMVGSATKLSAKISESWEESKDNVSTGYLIGNSISLEEIKKYVSVELRLLENDSSKNNKSKKNVENQKIYGSFLNKSYKVIVEDKYLAVRGLVVYATQCNIGKRKLKSDLKKLQEHFNNIDPDKKITFEDINEVLLMYKKKETFALKLSEINESIRIKKRKNNNMNVYNYLLGKAHEVEVGFRRKYMLGLVSIATKYHIRKDIVGDDLRKLQDYFCKRDIDNKITNKEVNNVLLAYGNKIGKKYKWETILEKAGLEKYKKEKCNRNGRTQKEHLELVRKKSGKTSQKEIIKSRIKELIADGIDVLSLTQNELGRRLNELFGIKRTTFQRHRKPIFDELGLEEYDELKDSTEV